MIFRVPGTPRWLFTCDGTRFWGVVASMLLGGAMGRGADLLDEARVALRTGNYKNAVELAQKSVRNQPRDEEAQSVLLRGLLTIGEYIEAQSALTNALAANPESLRLLWLGREVFQSAGNTNQAEAMVEQVRRLMGNRPWGFREPINVVIAGQALLHFGADPKEVLDKVFASAQKAKPELREAYLARGELALEKHDYTLAAKIWRAAAEKFPDDPDMFSGLAAAVSGGDAAEAATALEHALKLNPRHVPSLLLLAGRRIDAEDVEAAEKTLQEVLSINPWHPEAWAYRAVLAHFRNDLPGESDARAQALHFWASNPRVDSMIGQKLSQKYRFAEGAAHQRVALDFDPGYLPAKIQLAQDELRLGNEAAGWELAAEVNRQDGYDITAYNLVRLRETIAKFTTLTNADLVVRMDPKEALVYGPRALDLLERARRTLTAKYRVELTSPTYIEIFTDQKDFGVRTFGMPENPGFLGVCFGRVVTANSPAANTAQPVNWEAVLWHEFCHAVTLTLTHNKMPRWLSEGISVYEEIQADPSWGQHLNPRYREMILKGELTQVSQLSGAFLDPPSPMHLQFAYFEAEMVVDFLVQRFGADHLRDLLEELGQGTDIKIALEKHAAPLKVLDSEFARYARQQAEEFGAGLDWTKPPEDVVADESNSSLQKWAAARPTNYWALQLQAQQLTQEKKWDAARLAWGKLIDLQPRQSGPDSAYWHLAEAARELGDKAGEEAILSRGALLDHEAPRAYQRLVELATLRKDWLEVVRNSRRWLAVNPFVAQPYRSLALASEELGQVPTAIGACRTLLQLDPPNPPEVEFELAKLLHRSGDPTARLHLLNALEDSPRHRAALHLLWEMEQAKIARPTPQP